MKRLLALTAALALCLSMTACSNSSSENTTPPETSAPETSAAETSAPETQSAETAPVQGAEETTPAAPADGEAVKDTDRVAVTASGTPTETDHTQLVVGFDAEFPPYGYMADDGTYVGFDLDLAQAVCDYYGWELVRQPIDWDSKDMELGSGSIDCIWNGFTITGREEDYTWSEPYIDNSQVIVVAADSGITSYEDLAGKTVDVQADSSALAALEGDRADLAATFGNLQQVSNYNTAFMDLESGAVDAVAMDVGVASYEMAQRGDGYIVLDEILTTEQYAVGFKLGNTELRDEVQTALTALIEDGTIDSIIDKWNTLQSDVDFAESFCLNK